MPSNGQPATTPSTLIYPSIHPCVSVLLLLLLLLLNLYVQVIACCHWVIHSPSLPEKAPVLKGNVAYFSISTLREMLSKVGAKTTIQKFQRPYPHLSPRLGKVLGYAHFWTWGYKENQLSRYRALPLNPQFPYWPRLPSFLLTELSILVLWLLALVLLSLILVAVCIWCQMNCLPFLTLTSVITLLLRERPFFIPLNVERSNLIHNHHIPPIGREIYLATNEPTETCLGGNWVMLLGQKKDEAIRGTYTRHIEAADCIMMSLPTEIFKIITPLGQSVKANETLMVASSPSGQPSTTM